MKLKKSCENCINGGIERNNGFYHTYCKIAEGIKCWHSGKDGALWEPSLKFLKDIGFIKIDHEEFITKEEMQL